MNDLMTLARAARHLGVPQSWLRQQADAGTVPVLRAGNRLLFNVGCVREALAAKANRPNPASPEEEHDG